MGFLVGYSALHWLLLANLEWVPLSDDLRDFWLPISLSWLPVLLWLRHRIRLLKWGTRDDPFLGCVGAWILISVPTMIAQQYVETAAGKITRMEQISQIDARPPTRFYAVHDAIVDKAHAHRWTHTSTSGRYSENWDMSVYYVMPLLDSRGAISLAKRSVWLGTRYRHQISNRLSPEEKHVQLDSFVQRSAQAFAKDDFKGISYFSVAGNNGDTKRFVSAINLGGAPKSRDEIVILESHYEAFEARGGHKLTWLLGSVGAGIGLWFIFVLSLKMHPERSREWESGKRSRSKELEVALAMLIPRRGCFVTPVLLDLNLLVWMVMVVCGVEVLSASATDLLAWGGVRDANVHAGEIWRLVTSLFVHASVIHLVNNMVALVLLGMLVERAFGSWLFANVYLVTGLVASVASLMWHPDVVSVGASGCIFGIAGFGLVLLLVKKKRFSAARPLLLKSAAVYLGLNLLLGAILPGIDLTAHIAGFLTGAILGLIVSPGVGDQPLQAVSR